MSCGAPSLSSQPPGAPIPPPSCVLAPGSGASFEACSKTVLLDGRAQPGDFAALAAHLAGCSAVGVDLEFSRRNGGSRLCLVQLGTPATGAPLPLMLLHSGCCAAGGLLCGACCEGPAVRGLLCGACCGGPAVRGML